jgi:hypothetical protein
MHIPTTLRTIAAAVGLAAALLLGLTACEEEQTPETVAIADLKGDDWRRFVGETVTVEGIFVRDPLPMLVTDLEHVLVNMPMPATVYIVLADSVADEMNPEELGGATVSVTGTVNAAPDDEKYKGQTVVLAVDKFAFIERVTIYAPKFVDIPPQAGDAMPDRFAILFSGGGSPADNHIRYWNDLTFMYTALVNKFGFSAKNIAVLYADGSPPPKKKNMVVNYAATEANLNTVFSLLRKESTDNDLVVFYTTNHGGGFELANKSFPHKYGQLDTDGDEGNEGIVEKTYNIDFNGDGDKFDSVSWDEHLIAWGGVILDDSFAAMLQDIKYKHMVIIMEQCFSGGLIADMTQPGNKQVIVSAATQYERSWAMPTANNDYDEFVYHLTAALNGAAPAGKKVDADANKDGKISLLEAFNYAQANDTSPETPQYEDSGDGVSHSGKMPASGEGKLGAQTFLD